MSTRRSAVAAAAQPDWGWRESTVGALLEDAVRQWPERIAVQWPVGGRLVGLTWRQVQERASAAAQRLANAPVPGPVAVYAPNGPGWYVALWAVALSGRVLVPINPALTRREVVDVVSDCGAAVVLAAREHRGADLVALAKHVGVPTYDIDRDESWCAATVAEPHSDRAAPADTFVVQYTSGTTGKPKGAMLSHRVCVNTALTMLPGWRCGEHEVCCSALPLHHVGGLLAHAVALAAIGARYVLLNSPTPREFGAAAVEAGATMLAGVPTNYLRLLDDRELAGIELPELRLMMVGGASIPPTLIERIEGRFGAAASVMYGQSEAPAITATALDDDPVIKATTVGRPLPLREVSIVDPVTGCSVHAGEIGEILVRTPIRMQGYLDDPAATAEVLDADGWLHTGDLGALDAAGLLRFHGRLREMIVCGGENIYPREIETVLEQHPAVAQAAVVGVPDARWGEIVGAAVVLRTGTPVSKTELADWAAARLARFKRPQLWQVADELPMTASGKPQKFKIAAALAATAAVSDV